MSDGDKRKRSTRRWLAGVAGAVLVVFGVAAVAQSNWWTAEPVEPVEDLEVCDATEYEGCPARWEYLWADDTD